MEKTNYNDLFKSELGVPDGDHLVDCPHCEASITKGDLRAARAGRGKTTHITGAKHGKSSAHVRDQNPEGGTMRGGRGSGVLSPSRGVPGASKVDEVAVQSTDRAKRKNAAAHQGNTPSKKIPSMAKGDADSGSEYDDDDESGDDSSSGGMGKGDPDAGGEMDAMSKSEHGFKAGDIVEHVQGGASNVGRVGSRSTDTHVHFIPRGPGAKGMMVPHTEIKPRTTKSITIRGSEHVMWVDDGSDAALAKSIAEGALGGTPPTQPLDLNNDMSRLLI